MGIKLIILLALLVGVLYSLHLLVKDYQALSAGSRLFRMLFKRDTSSQIHTKPTVRWKRILRYDPIQCGRYFYCELGAQPANNEVRQGFIYMLKYYRLAPIYALHELLSPWQRRSKDGAMYLLLNERTHLLSKTTHHHGGVAQQIVKLKPSEENKSAHSIFQEAYESGKMYPKDCRMKYPMCIFDESLLFDMVKYLLRHPKLQFKSDSQTK